MDSKSLRSPNRSTCGPTSPLNSPDLEESAGMIERIKAQKQRYQQLQQQHELKGEEIQLKDNQIDRLRRELDSLMRFKQEYAQACIKADRNEFRLKSVEDQFAEMQRQYQIIQGEALEEKNTLVEDQIRNLGVQSEKLRSSIKELCAANQLKIDQHQIFVNQHDQALHTVKLEVQDLVETIDSLNQQKDTFAAENLHFDKEIKEASQAVQQSQGQIQQLQESIQQVLGQIQRQNRTILDLHQQAQALQSDSEQAADQLQKNINDLERAIQNQIRNIQNYKSDRKNCQAKIWASQDVQTNLLKNIDSSTHQRIILEAQLAHIDSQISKAEKVAGQLQVQNEQLRKRSEKLKQRLQQSVKSQAGKNTVRQGLTYSYKLQVEGIGRLIDSMQKRK